MIFSNAMIKRGCFGSLGPAVEHELQTHKRKYIAQGVLFILAGMISAVFPASTVVSLGMIIGALLLVTGLVQLVLSLKSRTHWWSLFSALLSIAIGAVLLIQPLPMLLAFMTLLAIFLTIEGILELLLSLQFRPARNWNWMFISGVITIILAMLLWIGWPIFGFLYVGWAIAINLIFYGVSLLMLVRTASKHPPVDPFPPPVPPGEEL